MIDPFLDEIFISNSITSALGRNRVYASSCTDSDKQAFREKFAERLHVCAKRYAIAVSDDEHCVTIGRIADALSGECPKALCRGRLRYGTAQKAFNLYLKFLWRSGCIPEPPHCPIDRIVLSKAGITDPRTGEAPAWTLCDSEAEYRRWVAGLKAASDRLSLAQWEQRVWLEGRRTKNER